MDGPCNTAQILCTRCQDAPRLPGQRWCRSCLTAAQRQRRAAQRVAQAADRTGPVPPAEAVTQAPRAARPEAVTAPARPLAALLGRTQVPQEGG